jgi:hypothetical protein
MLFVVLFIFKLIFINLNFVTNYEICPAKDMICREEIELMAQRVIKCNG